MDRAGGGHLAGQARRRRCGSRDGCEDRGNGNRAHLAVRQLHEVGSVGGGGLRSVGGHDDGDAQLAVHAEERVQEVLLGHRVQLRGGLVEHEQPRLQGQHGRQVHHLLLASRQVGHGRAEPRLYAEEVRDLGHAPPHGVLAEAHVLQPERQLVPYGVAHQLVLRVLRDVAHLRGPLGGTERCGGAAQNLERALLGARRGERRLEAAQKRGLAAAGGAQKQRERSFRHPPVERTERGRRRIGVREREALRPHRVHRARSLASSANGANASTAKGT